MFHTQMNCEILHPFFYNSDVGWLVDKKAQAGVSRMYEITKNSGIVKIAEYRGARSYARFGMTSWVNNLQFDQSSINNVYEHH